MSSKHPPRASGVSKREFIGACAQFATGVCVATLIDAGGAPQGITVNSFTSVSLVPPLVLICIGHSAAILKHFRPHVYFALNMLSEDQRHVSERFARRGGARFEGASWHPGHTGAPLIEGVLATMECRLARAETAGDHDILIGEALHATARAGRPLVYYGSAYRRLEP